MSDELPDAIRGFTPAQAREEYVRVATDAVCDFDPQAAEYRARTEAWVRIALTAAWAKEDAA